jgi:hypothetical protein
MTTNRAIYNFFLQNTHLVGAAIKNSNLLEPPSAWMQYGTSPTEIILAIAFVIIAIAVVIGALTLLVQVLVRQNRS